ncbi:MAG: M15 family metallopeptidase [Nocardioides sp.]|nr:M15 family metallopeptidase [Nocardioides sp.]
MRSRRGVAGLVLGTVVLAGCATGTPEPGAAPPSTPSSAAPDAASSPDPAPETEPPTPGTAPPAWLGARVLPETATGFGEVRRTPRALRTRRFTLPDTVGPLPGRGFASDVVAPAPRSVLRRSTWQPECPVTADELAWIRVAFWGFDDARHTGELLVATSVADDVVRVFRDLYRARFPLEEMRVVTPPELDAPPIGDGNNTTGFVCRPSVGGARFSEHAYGRAVDVNPFQNPYVRETDAGRVVLPELASAYLDRDRDAPGIMRPGGPVVTAFERIGWVWGGTYRTLKDYHHFSSTGL